jgi:hypothetical protein
VCATCEVGVFESLALAACDGFSWQAKLPFTFCFFISYCPMDGNPIMSGYCIQFLGSLGTIRELPEEQIFVWTAFWVLPVVIIGIVSLNSDKDISFVIPPRKTRLYS